MVINQEDIRFWHGLSLTGLPIGREGSWHVHSPNLSRYSWPMQVMFSESEAQLPLHIRRAVARLNRFLCPVVKVIMLQRWSRVAALIIACAVLLLPAVRDAAAQDNNAAKITTPKEGDVLVGLVTIQGTASHPNFQRYLLEFDSQDDDVERWFPISGQITQQVGAGILGQWNTNAVPDGRYQIRLRVILRDGTVFNSVVQNL